MGGSGVPAPQPAHRARKEKYMNLECTVESDHASHAAPRLRHCAGCGFYGLAAAAGLRRRDHTATPARRPCAGASGEQAVPGDSRCRHPELCLPALRRWRRLRTLHAGGHPVRRGRWHSSPTTSAPTRLSLTLIQRWWPMARFAPRGSTGTQAASGPRCTQLRRQEGSGRHRGCGCLAPARWGWVPESTDRWR